MNARRRLAGWLILFALIGLQWALFRQFALREITWSYPAGADQAGYLMTSYAIHEHMWQGGLGAGLSKALDVDTPQGFLLPFEAAVGYLVAGPSRLTALALNFLHFAALQCLMVVALRTLHRGWSLPAIGVGLLLCAALPFQPYGGMADFRLDFATACLFGMFAAAGMCSDGFRRRGWTIATLALGTVCVWTRHIAVTYVFGVLGAFAVLAALRRRDAGRGATVKRTVLVAAALAALTAPPLWANRKAIHAYYVVGHVTGAEKGIRARQFGVKSIGDALLFYPLSVGRDQAGPTVLWGAGVLGGAALLSLTPWLRRRRDATAAEPLAIDPANGLAFLALCVAVPIAVLTANESKSPVVGGVVVPPLICLVATGAWLALRRDAAGLAAMKVLGAVGVAVGLSSYVGGVLRPVRSPLDRADARTMVGVYDALARYAQDAGWSTVRMASTSVAEHVWPAVLPVLAYERQRWLPEISVAGLSIFAPDPKTFLEAIRGSDVVFLSEPVRGPTLFPFDKAMRRLHPELRALCDRDFFLLRRVNVFGAGLSVYVRPAASAEGASGNWISSSGPRPLREQLLRIDGDAIPAAPCPFDMENPVDVALPSPP